MTIEARARHLIAEELGVANEELMASNADLVRDLGADSTDRQYLNLALEDEFNLEIPDIDGQQLITVADVVTYIQRRTKTT